MKSNSKHIEDNNNQIPNGFKQTDIGLIPEDWDIDVIDNHFDIKQGKQLSKRTRDGNNQKKFLRTANLLWCKLDLNKLDEMHFTEDEEKRLKLQVDDLLVCEGGDIGRTAIWRSELQDCYYQNHIHRLRLKNDTVNPLFFMNWMYYGMALSNKYFGIGNRTTIPNLSASRLKAFQFPLPPLPEQKKIAHVLSKIQQAIETQEQIIKTTQELKKALMRKLFTEGLNGEPQKQTEIGPIPESWEVKEFAEIADDFIGGGTPSTSKEDYWNGDIHWTTSKRLDTENIYLIDGEKRITKVGLENSSTHLIPKNNLIISTRVTVGKIAINKIDIAISQDLTGLFIDKTKYSLEFLAYSIYTERVQKIFEAQKRGATIKGITRDDLKEIKISIPEIKTQNKIANIIINIDSKLFIHKNKRDQLMGLFKNMLNQLMTGQIRVKDIDFGKVENLAEN